MRKFFKFLSAILLMPVCLGLGKAVWHVVRTSGHADTVWAAMLGGVACWLVIYLLLPKPMWIYVFGHELTHALWTWLFGGRVKRFKAGSDGGHVVVTKTNFLIALAPYFFPLYAAGVVTAFCTCQLAWDLAKYAVWFHLLLGAAYAFHVSLTWHILQTRQSDITDHGYLFSTVVIVLGNLTVLLVGLPILTGARLLDALGWGWSATWEIYVRLGRLVIT